MGNLCSCIGADTLEERRQALLMVGDHGNHDEQPIKAAEYAKMGAGGFMSPVPELRRCRKGGVDLPFQEQENVSPNQHERTPDGYYTQTPEKPTYNPSSLRSPLRMHGPDYSAGLGYSAEFGVIG
jgi:hypothetical protein